MTGLVRGLPAGATFTLDTQIRDSHASGAAMAFTVQLARDGTQTQIRSLDVMQFNEAGLIVGMKAYYGPSDIPTT